MLDKNTMIKVINRSFGSVGYDVPDLGIRRVYEPGEIKEVTFEELLKLSYSVGGKKLIKKYLVMNNKDAVEEILGEVEPEYYYTDAEVKYLLLNGSIEQLEDCLDFADGGVIDLVKKLAVELQINDIRKREIITQKTGFDINSAIQVMKDSQDDRPAQVEQTRRRAAPISGGSDTQKPERRTPKYKVTSIKE